MTREEVEKAYFESPDIENMQKIMSNASFVDSITNIINCIEKDGLTVKQALEVLNGTKEIILWSTVGKGGFCR